QKDRDQYLMDHHPLFQRGRNQDGGDQHAEHAQRIAQRGGVDARIEGGQPQQPERAGQRQHAADDQQQRDRDRYPDGQGVHHGSMTSPRSRNLAMATEPTKPNRAISRAMSKYRLELNCSPSTRRISMPLMYMVSRASTRSDAAGPRSMRSAANTR